MITIRRLMQGEAPLYRELRLEAQRDSPEAFGTKLADALARDERSWIDQAEASASGAERATFIAVAERPVGLAALYRDAGDTAAGELIQMWVAPEFRGGPVARGLLDEIFRWAAANGFSRVMAEVMAGNMRALAFYRKYGFTEAAATANADGSVILTRAVGASG
jgi:ribosomal protein S18 acetylase RimI-like enzyme